MNEHSTLNAALENVKNACDQMVLARSKLKPIGIYIDDNATVGRLRLEKLIRDGDD